MKKLKTHKGASKRIWKSGSGKLMRIQAGRSHHRGRKSVKELLRRGKYSQVSLENPRIDDLIPY